MDKKAMLKKMIKESGKIVFLGGAGVSVESGIPDFRSAGGVFAVRSKYPPEEMLSRHFFDRHPDEFFEFYKKLMIHEDAKPNPAHCALARLEKQGKLTAVITQNIDGLHQAAGSKNVYELHGSIHRNYCMKCNRFFPLEYVKDSEGVPRCPCGGIVKPDVVLYEEALDTGVITDAVTHIMRADMLIVGGTSLQVYPAAGLIEYYRGNKLVLINKGSTPYDGYADIVINEPIGEVFRAVVL